MMRRIIPIAALTLGLAGWLISQATPDLVVTTVASSLATDPQTLATTGSIDAALLNNGTTDASAFAVSTFEDRNRNGIYDAGIDNQLGAVNVAGGVAAGATVTVNIPVNGTLLFKGNIIYVLADATAAVTESNETNNTRHTGMRSVFTPPASTALNPQLKWIRDAFTENPNSRAVTNTPSVGDVNGDGVPDIVFSTFDPIIGEWQDGTLRVVRGDTGAQLFSISDPALQVHPGTGVTLADIDVDGRPELITLDDECRLIAFEHDGSLKWRNPNKVHPTAIQCWMGVAAADLDRNGTPELIVGNQAYSATGTLLWTGTGGVGGLSAGVTTAQLSVAVDLDLDGVLEVVAGPTAYRADGSIYWDKRRTPRTLTDGFVAVGNFDADPYPEIVVRPDLQFEIYLLEHDGTVKWSAAPPVNYVRAGPPVVADFDNDGQPEIGVADRNNYIVYETNGSVKWTRPIVDASSGMTGSSVFDFNNDGTVEVVFADEQNFYIVRGTDGAILNQFTRSSSTAIEMPVVADVDNDGHADIVVPATPWPPTSDRGIRVYTGGDGNWANTRKVWNQHAYSVTNINDDLTVPAIVTPNWLTPGLNNFRAQALSAAGATLPNSAPDLLPSLLRRIDTSYPAQTELVVRVGNGGAARAAIHRVEFRNGPGGALLAAANTTRSLAPGEFEDVHALWTNPAPGQINIVATADTANAVIEGDETNNQTAAQLVIGQGPNTTVDDLVARFKDAGVDLKWTPVPGAAGYNIYRRTAATTAAAIRNGLVTAVGAFSDTGLTNNTTYFYSVRWLNAQGVESAEGTESSATPIPRAQRGDTPPTITSAAATRGRTGVAYVYQPAAADPDSGDVLAWQLTSPPPGMTINSATGRIAWTPGAGQGGGYRIQLKVTDKRSRSASQSFNLFIETQIINNAPFISSTPLTSGTVGRAYAYALRASDPDATDVLTYSKLSGPSGLAINAATGLVQWTPTATGTFPVSLRVRDLAGATVEQNFSIAVQNLNRAPVITSQPGLTGIVAQTYAYNATATDPDAGDTKTWSLLASPTGMTLNPATGVVLWTPTAGQVGNHNVSLQVRDTIGATATQNWTIGVAAVTNLAPSITSIAPTQSSVGAQYLYQITATDPESDSLIYSLTVAPAGMTVDATGKIQWTPAANQTGANNVTARVADSFGNAVTQNFVVNVSAADTTPPAVTILSPATNSTISGDITISGTVTDPNLVSWELEYQVLGATAWTRLANGTTAFTNAQIGTLPASLLADNPYIIRLVGRDQTQAATAVAEVRVQSGLYKPGAFQVTFLDMEVPAPNIPIAMRRVYDSTKPYANDFGPGWSLSFGEFDLRTDLSYNVYLTLPSGRRVTFTFAPVQSNPIFPTLDNAYLAPPGFGDELTNLDCPQFFGGAQGLVCLGGNTPLQPYSPRNFRLKTREGMTFLIANGLVTEIQDRAGNKTSITPTGITSWTGRSVLISRDGHGRITQITDSRGSQLRYSYDAAGRLAAVTDQLNRPSSFAYFGSTHFLTEIRSASGCTGSRQEFDATGRVVAFVDPEGRRTEISYDLATRTRTVTLPGGGVIIEVYDAQGNMLSRNDGTGRVTTWTYDAGNRVTSITLPSGRRVVYTYDAKGNLLTEANTPVAGAPIVTTYEYTALDLIGKITRPNGETVLHTYDAIGNLLSREVRSAANSLVSLTSWTWDAQSRRITETTGAGVTTTFGYNAFSELISERLPSGATKNYSYDASGNIVAYFNALGTRTDLEYDAYNKVTAVKQGAQTLSRYTWNEFGKVATASDGLNQTKTYAYSCSGDLFSVTNAQGQVHTYTRTPRHTVGSATDSLARTTNFTYDAAGRETAKTTAEGGVWASSWNPDSVIAAITRPTGATIQASYDPYGRIAGEIRPDRSIAYTFDNMSRMTQGVQTSGPNVDTTTFAWDAANRLVSTTQPGNKSVAVTYNNAGQRTTATAPDGGVITYSYNGDGWLSEVASGGLWTRFTYDANGRRTLLTHSNGASVSYAYNARNHLTDLVLRDGAGVVVRSWVISYDAAGRRTGAVLNDGGITWTYDSLNRLTGETIASVSLGNRVRAWTYDAVGNRQDLSPTFGLDHRLLTNSSFSFGYDASGNQTQKGVVVRNFDVMNQMTQANGGLFGYDMFGRFIRRQFATQFVYDESRIIQNVVNGGNRERYVLHPQTNEPLFQTGVSITPHFYLNGLMGSVTAMTDAAGTVVHRYGYDAWGEYIQNTGIFSGNALVQPFTPFGYTGAVWDGGAQAYIMQSRVYDPAQGRFLQKDPQGGNMFEPSTQHPYIYAKNNPLSYVDPSGQVAAAEYAFLITQNTAAKVSGAIIGTGAGFTATTLYFLGDFLGRVTPTGFDLATAWQQSANAAKAYSKGIEDAAAYLDTENISVADGMINGLQAGSPAGCGVTAPGAPGYMPNGFGNNPQYQGVAGTGFQPKIGPGGPKITYSLPAILGFQAGGLACGNSLANSWIAANAP